MNIGIVTTWFERGAAYVSKLYMDALQERNNVFVYARAGESYAIGNPEWDGPHVYWSKRIPALFSGTLISKKEFTAWCLKNKLDIILFNEQKWWPPLLWCQELGIKTIAYIDYYTEQTIPLYDAYDAVICNTRKHLEAFKSHANAIYIPWGTNTDLFKPKSGDSVDTVKTVFFHSCGMAPHRKGTDILIKAITLLEDDKFLTKIHTQVSLTKAFPELSKTINRLVNLGRLEIIEETVTAPGLYHEGDVYVYPSRLEGIGLTVAEAISCGLAVIVPDCGPMNEFVEPSFGETVPVSRYFARSDGYYWPQNEVNEQNLATVMRRFLGNKELVKSMKIEARNYARKKLDWAKNSENLNDFFQDIYKVPSLDVDKVKPLIESYESNGFRKFNNLFLRFYRFYNVYRYLFKKK